MKVAFLIIDVQEKYVSMDDFKPSFNVAKEYINYVSDIFRKNNQPVVHIRHHEKNEDKTIDDFQVSKEIVQKDTDYYIDKEYGSSFWKTNLEEILNNLGVELVICSGLSAAYCVLATYNGALERGFITAMLHNGLIGRDEEEVRFVHRTRNQVSYNVIEYMLNN
jgi:nicotinamidase-related amidase